MEEAVDGILSLEKAANPSGRTFGTSFDEDIVVLESPLQEITDKDLNQRPTKRKLFMEDKNRFIEQEIEIQNEMLSCMDKMEKSIYKLQHSVSELSNKHDENIQIWRTIRDDNNLRLKIASEELDIKKRTLELRVRAYDETKK